VSGGISSEITTSVRTVRVRPSTMSAEARDPRSDRLVAGLHLDVSVSSAARMISAARITREPEGKD